MNPPDPLKRSREVRIVRQYVEDGWLNKSALKSINNATEGDIQALIERGRARKKKSEGDEVPAKAKAGSASNSNPEPEPEEEEEPEPAPKEPQPEGEPVSENQISEQDFFDKYPKGSHVQYAGDEYVVVGHEKAKEGNSAYLKTVGLSEGVTVTLQEEHDEEVGLHEEPTKIPQVTTYPPQVFLLAYRDDEGDVVAEVFLNHQTLGAEHPTIDSDAIMGAISDPGEPQEALGGTLTYTEIGS